MSRVIHTEGPGKERPRLLKSIALAIRQLGQKQTLDSQTRDLAAFLVFALEAIAQGIEESVTAWEKRGYWLKADRFRMEWQWTGEIAARLRTALLQEDWATVASLTATIAQKVRHITVPERHRLGEPWKGAWQRLSSGK